MSQMQQVSLDGTTYKNSYPVDGQFVSPRAPSGKPAGRTSAEVWGKNDVTHTLATKRTFPMRIYHPSDVVVPNGSHVDAGFETTYGAVGEHTKVPQEGSAAAAGKSLEYFSSGGVLGFTKSGHPIGDRQPASKAKDYVDGHVIIQDGGHDLTSSTKRSFPARSEKEILRSQSARCAGRTIRTPDIVTREALHGSHPDARVREGRKLKKCMAPEGNVLHGETTNQGCLASDAMVRKGCQQQGQRSRNHDGFSLRVEQERKWRRNLLRGGEKDASTVSTLPAGFQSSKWLERDQLQARYGAQMVALCDGDVKLQRPLHHSDIIVGGSEKWDELKTTSATVHKDPYNRPIAMPRGGSSEASYASGRKVGSSEASYASGGPRFSSQPRSARGTSSEVSYVTGLSKSFAAPMPDFSPGYSEMNFVPAASEASFGTGVSSGVMKTLPVDQIYSY
jgi:hypothetical protein